MPCSEAAILNATVPEYDPLFASNFPCYCFQALNIVVPENFQCKNPDFDPSTDPSLQEARQKWSSLGFYPSSFAGSYCTHWRQAILRGWSYFWIGSASIGKLYFLIDGSYYGKSEPNI
jgi:hypothetical protein